MIASAVFAFLHFTAVFGIFVTVFYEFLALSESPTLAEARKIQMCDRMYGIFATVLLVVGFLRVLYFEKGREFYFSNPFFHAKLTLFVLVGLVSIYPTIRFIKWGAQTKAGQPPVLVAGEYRKIRMALHIELVLLLGTALCASLMARGVGM
jgi:putative membrane protein